MTEVLNRLVGYAFGLITMYIIIRVTERSELPPYTADIPQTTLCRECDDYAGDGMYCASNYLVRDFSTSRENCEGGKDEPQKKEVPNSLE